MQNGDWYLLPPGETLTADVIWWRPEREWTPVAASGGDPPTTAVTLIFRDQTGLAVDRCQLTFGGHVLWPHQTAGRWFVALRSEPAPAESQPPSTVANIAPIEREWPGEPPRGSRRWLRQRGKAR